jgi:putative flippase GtrA
VLAEGTVMTCSVLVRRPPAPTEVGGVLRSGAGTVARTARRWVRRLADGDAAVVQLVRFALAGGLATGVQVLLFAALAPVGVLGANVAAWGLSTALANELHRRRTFQAGERVGWLSAQWEGGGLSLIGLGATTGALSGLTVVVPDAGVVPQALLVLTVNVLVGVARFVALRWAFLVRPRTA